MPTDWAHQRLAPNETPAGFAPAWKNPDVPIDQHVAPLSLPAAPERGPHPGLRVGALVCHGFTGSPASMRPWAEHLAALGYAVEMPLLPGHGTTWRDMNTTTWDDWYDVVRASFDKLRRENDHVVLAGLSMGGALSLRLAADRPDEVAGIAVVNPAVTSANKQLKALPLLRLLLPSIPGIGNDIKRPGMDEHGYDRTPLKALHSMVRAWKPLQADLRRITAPLRLFRSVEDHVVDPSSARLILDAVSSRDVEEILLPNSYHVATLDNDADLVFTESAAFFRAVTDPRRPLP